jgi:hypothetical protein
MLYRVRRVVRVGTSTVSGCQVCQGSLALAALSTCRPLCQPARLRSMAGGLLCVPPPGQGTAGQAGHCCLACRSHPPGVDAKDAKVGVEADLGTGLGGHGAVPADTAAIAILGADELPRLGELHQVDACGRRRKYPSWTLQGPEAAPPLPAIEHCRACCCHPRTHPGTPAPAPAERAPTPAAPSWSRRPPGGSLRSPGSPAAPAAPPPGRR